MEKIKGVEVCNEENEEYLNEELKWDDIEYEHYEDITLKNSKDNFTSISIDMLLSYISESFPKEEELNSSLKKWFSKVVLTILSILTVAIVTIVILQGIGFLNVEEWTLRIFVSGTFLEIIAVVKIIIHSLFPKDDRKVYLEFIKNLASVNKEVNKKESQI